MTINLSLAKTDNFYHCSDPFLSICFQGEYCFLDEMSHILYLKNSKMYLFVSTSVSSYLFHLVFETILSITLFDIT